MNNQLIILAESIQSKIQQLQTNSFSAIDKDILLEELRNLYRIVQQLEISTSHSLVAKEDVSRVSVPTQLQENIAPFTQAQEQLKKEEKEKFNFSVGMQEDTSPSTELNAVSLEDLVADIQAELNLSKKREADTLIEKAQIENESTKVEQKENAPLNTNGNREEKYFNQNEQTTGIGGNIATSLNEAFAREEVSLNERVSSSPVKELHNLISSKTSLSSLLDFNSRILLTKELFNGNAESCSLFIAQLEKCSTLEEAKSLVNTNALSKGWRGDNEAVKTLVQLVRKVFA